MKTRSVITIPCLLVFATINFTSCGGEDNISQTTFREPVKTATAEMKEITPEVKSFGTITYYRKADVSSTTSGFIDSLGAEEGMTVSEGQTLATINNIQLQIQKKRTESQINQARSALELTEAKLREAKLQIEARILSILISELDLVQKKLELDDLERAMKNKEQLFAVGGMSEEAIHSVRMQYLSAKSKFDLAVKTLEMQKIGLRDSDIINAGYSAPSSEPEKIAILKIINTQTLGAEVKVASASLDATFTELEAINQLLNETTIRSPVTGIVGMRYLELGERVQPEAKLFTVLDTARVYAVFPVSEGDAILITEGMDVEISIDALNKLTMNAKIQLISPLVDPQTGNITVKAILPNNNLSLKPGMFVRARVISGRPRKTILIPKTCLAKKEGKRGEVFTVVRNRVFNNKVQTGIEKENMIEIVTGLADGDVIVDSPSPLLKEGQDVEIKND